MSKVCTVYTHDGERICQMEMHPMIPIEIVITDKLPVIKTTSSLETINNNQIVHRNLSKIGFNMSDNTISKLAEVYKNRGNKVGVNNSLTLVGTNPNIAVSLEQNLPYYGYLCIQNPEGNYIPKRKLDDWEIDQVKLQDEANVVRKGLCTRWDNFENLYYDMNITVD